MPRDPLEPTGTHWNPAPNPQALPGVFWRQSYLSAAASLSLSSQKWPNRFLSLLHSLSLSVSLLPSVHCGRRQCQRLSWHPWIIRTFPPPQPKGRGDESRCLIWSHSAVCLRDNDQLIQLNCKNSDRSCLNHCLLLKRHHFKSVHWVQGVTLARKLAENWKTI